MALTGILYMTLTDWAKRIDPDGSVAKIVELLAQTNRILDDMVVTEGNLPTGHQTSIRTGLPDVTWRMLNYGVQPSKSTVIQVTDTPGMLETLSQIDESIVTLNGNTAEFRLSEDRPFIEAMNQEMASTMFYGNTDTDPEQFLGLAPRYPYNNGDNVIDNGMTGLATTCTSIWLVCWGANTVHGFFPKGSQAGIRHRDVGNGKPVLVDDSASPAGKYYAYQTHYKWDLGLCVRDWRYVVRICNVGTSGTTHLFDPENMIEAYNEIPEMSMGKPVFYCNKTIKNQIDKDAFGDSNRMYRVVQDAYSAPVTMFWDVPIRKCDKIVNTESRLTGAPGV